MIKIELEKCYNDPKAIIIKKRANEEETKTFKRSKKGRKILIKSQKVEQVDNDEIVKRKL